MNFSTVFWRARRILIAVAESRFIHPGAQVKIVVFPHIIIHHPLNPEGQMGQRVPNQSISAADPVDSIFGQADAEAFLFAVEPEGIGNKIFV